MQITGRVTDLPGLFMFGFLVLIVFFQNLMEIFDGMFYNKKKISGENLL